MGRKWIASSIAVVGAVVMVSISPVAPTSAAVAPPPTHSHVDYQLGGAYEPRTDIGIVVRDVTDSPVAGKYNICYVNAFQTQPDATTWWKRKHRALLLRKNNRYVIDGQWNEILFDTRTAAKRRAIARIVNRQVNTCKAKGFNAVELDNLDSYSRSRGVLRARHNLAMAKLVAGRAHSLGLAVGQKNAAELSRRARARVGFDFAVAEECERYLECDRYLAAYGANVIEIEYSDYSREVFDRACASNGATISIVRRDRMLTTPSDPAYVYESC